MIINTTDNIIMSFYNVTNINFSNNILITDIATFSNTTGSHNNTQSNNLFINNKFPVGGTTISSIQYLDVTYNATEWALWSGGSGNSRLSYYSNGSWTDLPNTFINIFTITPISDPTIYVNNGFQLYDFLSSDREQCIITNDINVNFNLMSSNGIKTILSNNLIKITKI
jgi:hypothetical protein